MGIETLARSAPWEFSGGGGLTTSDAALRQVLHGLPGVDQVGGSARDAALAGAVSLGTVPPASADPVLERNA